MVSRGVQIRPLLLAMMVSSSLVATAPVVAADSQPATDLDGVVVTASRTDQSQADTLAPLTVIDRADIERLQPRSLMGLLRGLPGMSVSNQGGPGKATSIHLRGTEASHVLILVNGVPMGSATTGSAAIADIPVDQIQRIEIVRGPFSSLYGSNAMGGVIQIFTRRPDGAFTPHVKLALGSHHDRRLSAGVAGKSGKAWYALNLTHRKTDGINAMRCKPFAGPGCVPADPDRDGFANNSISARGGYRFNDAWSADAMVFQTWGRNEYDGSTTDMAHVRQQIAGAHVRYQPRKNVVLSVRVGQSADLSDNYLRHTYQGKFDSRRDLGSIKADIGMLGGLLTLGYDWQRDEVSSSTVYALDHRVNRGAYAQWQQHFADQSVQASVRRDDNGQFGGKTTGSLLWGWHLTQKLRLSASYGTAFMAPTFNQLYYPGYGNPSLGPETSRSFDIGLRATEDWGHWSINAYQNHIDNMIAFDAATFAPSNIDSARIRGIEAAVDGQTSKWNWRVSATLMDPRELTPGFNHDNILPRRARQQLRIDLGRQFGRLHVGGSVYTAGKRYDDLGNVTPLGGYALADLRAAWKFNTAWQLHVSLDNLFDRRYQTAFNYNQPGRNVLVSLSWRPTR